MNNIKTNTVTQAVKAVFNAMTPGEVFSGRELRNRCVRLDNTLKDTYIETFLRTMRKYCTGRYIVVRKNDSIYQKLEPAAVTPVTNLRLDEMHEQDLFSEGE